MSKKWSSFGEQQLLTENWREFLTEEEIEEGLFDRVKATAKGAYKGGKEAWEKSRPPVMSDYPATELTTIINMISKADPTADTAKIVDELEAMLKAQNFVINEQDDKIMLGADLELKLDPETELARVLLKLEKENPNYYNQIVKAFGRGGFDVSAIPLADAKPEQPTADQAQDAAPATEPAQTPAEEPEQAATVRVSPKEYFGKMKLTYTDPETKKNYNLQKLALKMAQALNSDLGINERREPKEFPAVVEFFKTVKNSGIKKTLFKALADYLKATNFQIGKETIATLRPELSRDSGEPQQIDTTGASYAPTSGGLDAYSQDGELEDIPSPSQDKVEPDSIKMTADTARAQDLDAYSGDAATAQDAEKEDKPADEKSKKKTQ